MHIRHAKKKILCVPLSQQATEESALSIQEKKRRNPGFREGG